MGKINRQQNMFGCLKKYRYLRKGSRLRHIIECLIKIVGRDVKRSAIRVKRKKGGCLDDFFVYCLFFIENSSYWPVFCTCRCEKRRLKFPLLLAAYECRNVFLHKVSGHEPVGVERFRHDFGWAVQCLRDRVSSEKSSIHQQQQAFFG